jgi:hypothetical protein
VASDPAPLGLPLLTAAHADPLGNAWTILRTTALGFAGILSPSLLDAINPFAHSLLALIARSPSLPTLLAAQSIGWCLGRGSSLWRGLTSIRGGRATAFLLAAGSPRSFWPPAPGWFGGTGFGCALGAANHLLGATFVAFKGALTLVAPACFALVVHKIARNLSAMVSNMPALAHLLIT